MSATAFVGWIPNVGGRLSFSHIGETNHPGRCQIVNEADPVGRVVLCAQNRPLSDGLLPSWYVNYLYGYTTRWVFVLLAQTAPTGTDRLGCLEGHIFAFSRKRWNATRAGGSASEVVKAQLNKTSAAASDQLASTLRAEVPKLMTDLTARAMFVVDCRIERTGQTTLTPAAMPANLRFAPAITQPGRSIEEGDVHYMCNQAFMFLKDIAHAHRHHAQRQDTITLSYPATADFGWIRDTQYSIHRRVVAKRRAEDPHSLYDALGLMAYMASLKKLAEGIAEDIQRPLSTGLISRLRPKGSVPSGLKIVTSYNLKETEDSIKARLESQRWRRVQMNIFVTAMPALIIALAAYLKPPSSSEKLSSILNIAPVLQSALPPNWLGLASLIALVFVLGCFYGTINPFKFRITLHFRSQVVRLWQGRNVLTLRLIGGFIIGFAAAGAAAVLAFPSVLSPSVGWTVLGVAVVVPMLAILFAPAVRTLPDLIKAILRTLKLREG